MEGRKFWLSLSLKVKDNYLKSDSYKTLTFYGVFIGFPYYA